MERLAADLAEYHLMEERQMKTNLALKILLLALTLGLGIKDECLFQLQS